jgi:excisionase family DNA binding protein
MVITMTWLDKAPSDEVPDLMTPAEVAKHLRVDPKTVTRWANAVPPRIRSIRTPGGHRRFYTKDVWTILTGGKL